MIESADKIKVLMLDDEKFLLDIYKIAFEKRGFEVITCTNSDDAFKVLRGGYDPDAILFDITMPDSKSGYEFVEIIEREKLVGHALKIALTNEGQDGAKHRMGELGADAHLLKASYLPAEIAAIVTDMLQRKN